MNIRDFILWEMRSRDAIDFKRCYVDIAADLIAGLLLSQVIYWHLPDQHGNSKLRVHHDDHDWLAKKRDDWWDECRISPKQFDRAADLLEKRDFIITHVYRFDGTPIKHIRLNWDSVLDALESLAESDFPQRSKSTSPQNPTFPKGQSPNSPKVKMEVDQRGSSITETPAEITSKNTLSPNPSRGGQERERQFGFQIEEGSTPATGTQPSIPLVESEIEIDPKEQIVPACDNNVEIATTRKFDQFFPGKTRQTKRQELSNWVPEGPWLVDGKLDAQFVTWLAQKWVTSHGHSIHDARSHVQTHFKNDVNNLPIKWDAYHAESAHRVSVAIASDNLQSISQSTVAAALTPCEDSPMQYAVPERVTELLPVIAAKRLEMRADEVIPLELPPQVSTPQIEATEVIKPSIPPEGFMKNILANLKANSFATEERKTKNPSSKPQWQRLNELLQDANLRRDRSLQAQAQSFLASHPGYDAEYDAAGSISGISPEF